MMADMQSASGTSRQSELITQLLQAGDNRGVELRPLLHLRPQCDRETLHFAVERLVVVLDISGSDVAPRRQHVPMLSEVIQLRDPAESRHIAVGRCPGVTPPRMVGA